MKAKILRPILSCLLQATIVYAFGQHNYDNQSVIYSNNGNVGIGTTSPTSKLDISGASGTMSKIHLVDAGVGSSGGYFDINMDHTDKYAGGLRAYVPLGQPGIDRVHLGLYTTTHEGSLKSRVERLTITDVGNVGIGTLLPTSKFDIVGKSGIMSKIHVTDAGVGSDGGYFDINIGPTDSYAGGLHAYVPPEQPGIDRVYLGLYTTTYDGSLRSRIERLTITDKGDVGIGSTTPDSKLTVNGDIHAEEVRVDLNVPGPDYVFEEDYDLPTLESLQNYIRENKHLPEVPSAEEMEAHGIDLGEMNMLLLKKVEELTLYVLSLKQEIETLKEGSGVTKESE